MSDSDTQKQSVVVGIDGSQAAIQASEWAVDEAVSREVPLRLIYVIPEQAEPAPFAAVGNERMEHEYGETALRIASAAVQATGQMRQSRDRDPARRPCDSACRELPWRRTDLHRLNGDRAHRKAVFRLHRNTTRRGCTVLGRDHPQPAQPARIGKVMDRGRR